MAAAKKSKTITKPKLKRLVVELTDDVHRKLKIAAAQEGLSMRDYILALLKQKGIA